MKKNIAFLLVLLTVLFCFSACGEKTQSGENGSQADSDAEATSLTGNKNGYIQHPDNALKQLIPGMPLCYLDYAVENPAFAKAVDKAVTPMIITKPSEFKAFFDTQTLAKALQDEMFLTDIGKSVYVSEEFYKTWNLVILSVREKNAETKHTIDTVTYDSDSCVLHIYGTRDVAEGEGDETVVHYVFRVPANYYNGVSHSFKKVS